MTTTEWGVVIAGVALIGAVNWWFFLAGAGTAAATDSADGQEVIEKTHHG